MTNQMIILMNQLELYKSGVLKGTGRNLNSLRPDGTIVQVPEIQSIHTFAKWKELGYRVKRGEKAIAKFPIWKYTTKKSVDMSEEEAQESGYCFMKMSAFFTDEQVEKIED